MQKSAGVTSLDDKAAVGGYGEVVGLPEFTSAPPAIVDIADTAMDADEEEYGEVIDRSVVANQI